MSTRIGLRAMLFRPQAMRFAQRRHQSAVAEEAVKPSFWNSPVGPKTVHFWAPIMKWGVVIAGAADFFRPASQLSVGQNAALMATGAIWTRWCLIIKPRNVFLASVNFMLFCVGFTQVGRALWYQQSIKGDSTLEEAKKAVKEEGELLKEAVKDPKATLSNIVNTK